MMGIILNKKRYSEPTMLKHIIDVFWRNIFKAYICQEILFFRISKEIIDLGQPCYIKQHVNDSLNWTSIK